jgi:tetratricopeptide (TPR) repeat protein
MKVFSIIFFWVVCACAVQGQTASAKWKIIETEADTLMDRKDFAGAIDGYTKVIDLSKLKDRESKGVLYKRAICYYSIGEFGKALQDVDIFIQEVTTFPQAKLLRAFINRELDNTEAQLSDINDLLALNSMNPDLLKWRSVIYLNQEKYNEAKKELTGIQQIVNDEEIETQLGFAYSNLEKPDSAFIHYEKAMNLNGGYVPAYLYMGSLCLEQEAYELAITYIDLGLRLESSNLTLIFYKGIGLVETKKEEEGCRLLLKAFKGGVDEAGNYLKQYCYSID